METQSSKSTQGYSRYFSPLLMLLTITFFVRGGILFSSLSTFNADPDSYAALAQNWFESGVFGEQDRATAFRPPLYPWTLKELTFLQKRDVQESNNSFVRYFNAQLSLSKNASIALWHWILGVIAVFLVYKVALAAQLSPRLAALAGLGTAFDPILLQQSRLVMTETLAAFFSAILIFGVVYCVRRRKERLNGLLFAALGVVYGLSTLCRPAFFAFVGLVFLGLLAVEITDVFSGTSSKQIGFKQLVNCSFRPFLFLIGIAIAVTPWLVRNVREFDRPILTTTHGGYTLYLANNPEIYSFYQTAPALSLWNPDSFHERRAIDYQKALKEYSIDPNSKEAELFQDEWTKNQAKEAIKSNPRIFAYSCFVRFCELWRVLPHNVEREALLQQKVGDNADPNAPDNVGGSKPSRALIGIACFYTAEFLFALLGLFAVCLALRKKAPYRTAQPLFETPLIWGILLILSVQIPHLIYWTNMRMRAPLETFIPILSVLGVAYLKTVVFRSAAKSI